MRGYFAFKMIWSARQYIYSFRNASKLRSNFACEMIFQMKSWEGWSARQRMTRRPTVVHLLLVTGLIFSQRWTLSSFYLMPTWAFEFFIAFCPAAPLRALQGYELQLQVLLFEHLQTLACLFLATCEQMKPEQKHKLTPSVFSSEKNVGRLLWNMMNNKDMFESHFLNGRWHVLYGFHISLPSTRCGHSSYSASDMICCCLERTMPSIVDG